MRRARRLATLLATLLATALLAASAAHATELVPPPEAGEGDYELELADSLAEGAYETLYSATGTSRTAPKRSQRVRFRGGGTSGSLREGDDALAGGRLEAPLARGRLRVGRLAPRWGRGLLFGAPAEPWSAAATDRGEGAAYRGRAGEGATWEAREQLTVLAGRFAKRPLWAARACTGPLALGGAAIQGAAQASTGFERDDVAAELAADGRGRWRAEAAWSVREGPVAATLFARGGLAGYRSLAEPKRSGPARAVAASVSHAGRTRETHALLAAWRFAPGAAGARASLDVRQALARGSELQLGLEEQRGTLRDPFYATSAGPTGLRQGAWCEWRGESARGRLALRHEWWGARAFARAGVRRLSVVSAEAVLPAGARLGVLHAAWVARRGERAYLLETAEDRLVLRALSGTGSRTRCELAVPVLGGRARVSVALAESGGLAKVPRWTAEWTRRARL